jgi:hypothetical protein
VRTLILVKYLLDGLLNEGACKIFTHVTAVLRTAYLTGCPGGWKLYLQYRCHALSCDNRKTLYYTNVVNTYIICVPNNKFNPNLNSIHSNKGLQKQTSGGLKYVTD